jgi:hypothetical protein
VREIVMMVREMVVWVREVVVVVVVVVRAQTHCTKEKRLFLHLLPESERL